MFSLYKHAWYLVAALVPSALLDNKVSNAEKKNITEAILVHKMPSTNASKNSLESKSVVD